VAETYKRKSNTKCAVCGKLIYRRPSQIERNNGSVFCSIFCYGISTRKETPCIVCGKPILASQNKKTCSRACSNTHRIGIKYKQSEPKKDKVKYQQGLKLRLLKMRGMKCEKCGYDKYEILQIHHKDRDRGNNDLDNLELICPNCHYEEHLLEKSWLRRAIEK
jgi:5-methylcytosine-specific restriction endonuclease McrA